MKFVPSGSTKIVRAKIMTFSRMLSREMAIRPELSKQIAARIADYVDPAPALYNIQEAVTKLGALPILSDWGGCSAIRPDGEIIVILADAPEEWYVESDQRLRNSAIYQGSLIYPELKELVPERPSSARVCPDCQGTGTHPINDQLEHKICLCWCGGLGWIP
jgi:hypothetical protein